MRSFIWFIASCMYKDIDIYGFGFVLSLSTGQTCPEGRSTNRTQVLCEVLHPTLSRKTREIDHNTGNYVPYSFRWVCGFFNVPC